MSLNQSTNSYSLKNVEKFYEFKREGDVQRGDASQEYYIEWLETNPMHLPAERDMQDVNFPLIAAWTKEKIKILRPWGNLLIEK